MGKREAKTMILYLRGERTHEDFINERRKNNNKLPECMYEGE